MNDRRILIDTSVWIDYFKGTDAQFQNKVDEALTYGHIYVPKVVLAELIQGARSEKEITVIEDFIDAFHVIDHTQDTWLKAGRLSFSMKKKGVTMSIIDCYIAVMADENGCIIFSLDRHFTSIKRFLNIELLV
ncbi:MAG: PIN domain-containing protein [bacterium]